MPSTNERWAQDGTTGGLKGAPKVTVILNLFSREVREARKCNATGRERERDSGDGAAEWGNPKVFEELFRTANSEKARLAGRGKRGGVWG